MTSNNSLKTMLGKLSRKRVEISSQFAEPVIVEEITVESEDDALIRVSTSDGQSKEVWISIEEIQEIISSAGEAIAPRVDSKSFFLFIESARIKTAIEENLFTQKK